MYMYLLKCNNYSNKVKIKKVVHEYKKYIEKIKINILSSMIMLIKTIKIIINNINNSEKVSKIINLNICF